MVDIFVFCTDVEVVFTGLINKYRETIQDMVRILGKQLTSDTVIRLSKILFRFMPKWLHKRVRMQAIDIWKSVRPVGGA